MPGSKPKSKKKVNQPNGLEPVSSPPTNPTEDLQKEADSTLNNQENPLIHPNCTLDEKDLSIVKDVLNKLNIASPDFSDEQRLNALCLIFKETVGENVRCKDLMDNLKEQLEKCEQTKGTLQKLCEALQLQVKLKAEEGELKLKEETQKRIELTENFQKTMDDLSKLMSSHSDTNAKLKEENSILGQRMKEILDCFEQKHSKFEHLSQEHKLLTNLYEAKLSKSKLELAELSADFTKERLVLQKTLNEAYSNIDILLKKEENYLEQIELYKQQMDHLQKESPDVSGIVFFRSEIEKLAIKMKQIEKENFDWKGKFEASNNQVINMTKSSIDREIEMDSLNKKLTALNALSSSLNCQKNDTLLRLRDAESKLIK